jgi:hypothetical protein
MGRAAEHDAAEALADPHARPARTGDTSAVAPVPRVLPARGAGAAAHTLQRLAGNRAVTALVSRQAVPGTDQQDHTAEDGGVTADVPGGVPQTGAPGSGGHATAAPTPPPPSNGSGAGNTPGAVSAPARPAVVPTRTPQVDGGLDSGGGLPSRDAGTPTPEDTARTDAAADGSAGGGGAGPGAPVGTTHPPGYWTRLIADLGGGANAARDALELLRPIPGFGAFPGLAADTIGLIGDLNNFQNTDQPFTLAVTGIRDVLSMVNNLIGSLSGTVQTVQDAGTASVVGAEVDVATAPADEFLKVVKVWLDGIQLSLDVIGAAAAAYNAAHAPRGSQDLQKSNAILQMFEANILGDVVSTTIDAIDLATAGFANGDNVKGAARWIYTFLKAAGPIGRAVVATLMGWFGVHGSSAMPASTGDIPEPVPAQRLAADPQGEAVATAAAKLAFADLAIAEIGEMHDAWRLADTGLTTAMSVARTMEDRIRALATQANEGRDPFLQVRDSAHRMLDQMTAQITQLTDLGQIAGSAQDKTHWIVSVSDQVLGALDQVRLPDIHVPHDADQGIVAGVVTAGADLADRALQAALGPARRAVDEVRDTARQPVLVIRGHAADVAEFAQFLQQFTQQAIGTLTARIASFSAGLAHVQNGEQFIDLFLHQVTEMLGIPGGAGLEDARREWDRIGAAIAAGEVAARQYEANARRELVRAGRGAPAGAPAEEGEATGVVPPAAPLWGRSMRMRRWAT